MQGFPSASQECGQLVAIDHLSFIQPTPVRSQASPIHGFGFAFFDALTQVDRCGTLAQVSEKPRPAVWWIVLTSIVAILVASVCAGILWSYIPPVKWESYFFLFAMMLSSLSLVWLVLAVVGLVKYRGLAWTAITPVLVVVTAVSVALSIPSTVAFAMSKDALNRAAETCPIVPEHEQIGAYNVWTTRKVDTGCFFFVRGGGSVGGTGLAHLPDGPPDVVDTLISTDFEFTHRDGDWYEFVGHYP